MVLFVTIYLALGAKYRIKNKVVTRNFLCAFLQSSRKFWSKNERGGMTKSHYIFGYLS